MSRFSRERRVFFIEESLSDARKPWLEHLPIQDNLRRVIPHTPPEVGPAAQTEMVAQLLREMCEEWLIKTPVHWFYTPMMLGLSFDLPRSLVVYDCMDELRNFLHAPSDLGRREQLLLSASDVVFTGGMALYEAKRSQHPNVHAMPSSVDFSFFSQARTYVGCPEDQAAIPRPRIGYCGVIDERLDLSLIDRMAAQRPDYQVVMVGPLVKIDPETVPRRPNIHYLGGKNYRELPQYLAGWDVAIMPFALNDATRFISPTKTPEYLAAGRPVVSTAIHDVIDPYGRHRLVRIGHDHEEFIAHIDALLSGERDVTDAVRDEMLSRSSWDATFQRMRGIMDQANASVARGANIPLVLRPEASHV